MGDTSVEYDVLERILAGSQDPTELHLETLKSITKDFSEDRKIGAGGFGDIYKGVLPNGSVIAVKRIIVGSRSYTLDDKLFDQEVKSLFRVKHHPKVVRFLGVCYNTNHALIRVSGDVDFAKIKERLLCFEYISNGSLNEHITDELRGHDWNIRYEIIKGICEGLQYLHKMGIIHMDLKPANIMVDNCMVPKITDFGLARSDGKSHTTGERFGSPGYSAPEYMKGGSTTVQCDIYSLGAIINELVTGRKGIIPDKYNVLRRWRHRLKSAGNRQLLGQQITKCIEIAERCMENEPAKRPSLATIIDNLDKTGNMNAHNSAVGQVSPSWWDDDDMLCIHPLKLCFAFELVNKEISNEVVLTNETGNCIAFNINTESLLQYCIEPKKGIVQQGSKSTVKITLEVQATRTQGSMLGDDKFIMQSTKVKGGLTVEEINEDMFVDKDGKVVDEVILAVVYDDKPEIAQADDQPPVSVDCKLRGQGRTKRQRINFRQPLHISSTTNMNDTGLNTEAVSAMTGAMGGLRPKLLDLLKEQHNLETSVKKDVKSLERQLMSMHAGLYKLSWAQKGQINAEDKEWANDMRELSYEIEDKVDDLMLEMEQSGPSISQDFLKERLEVIKDRVKEVSGWHATYKVPDSMATHTMSSTVATIDPRIWHLYKDHKELVGINGRLNELLEMLAGRDDHNVSKKKLNIISIFGEGGLGKTTLAKTVFNNLPATMEFVVKAFVSVGRNPDIKRVLKYILNEIDKNNNVSQDWEESHIIDKIRNVLMNKRYFIVIDDIWDIQSWKWIKCSLIDNNNGSRVMTTTRIYNVGESSGDVFKLEPLSDAESKQLFYTRLACKSTSISDQPDEQSTEYILEKCGGLPLAIITIASLLDGKRVEDWAKVYNSIKFGHEDNKAENTEKILLFSYFDLPCHLKTCLLYISIYPEDHAIEKRTLVWKWIAEGFVRQEKGKTLFEVGEGYFNELINRSIIQPVERIPRAWDNDPIETGSICGCRVHDMVLDLISSMAKKENFVTVLDNDEQHLSSKNDARILAVHKRSLEQHDLDNTCKQVMRSFNSSAGCDLSRMGLDSLLPSFRVLRVLSLEYCEAVSGKDASHLKNVAHLRHLRYLSLYGTIIEALPMEIGDLRCLQILDLTDTEILVLPKSLTLLRELKSLLCYTCSQPVTLPDRMGSLTSLEELRLFLEGDTSELTDVVEELGTLTELRVLQIKTGSGFNGSLNKALVESVNKLKKMEELDIHGYRSTRINIWDDYSPCQLLRHLSLDCTKMPVWIDVTSLRNISYLELHVTSFTPSDLVHLGSLPELRSLVLLCDDGIHGVVAAADGDAFPKLRYFKTSCLLRYVQGAMRCLESLWLDLMAQPDVEIDFDSLQCLHSLVKVSAAIKPRDLTTAAKEEAEAIRASLRRAVDNHPNHPVLAFVL